MWNEKGVINRDVIAKTAAEIAKLAGLLINIKILNF